MAQWGRAFVRAVYEQCASDETVDFKRRYGRGAASKNRNHLAVKSLDAPLRTSTQSSISAIAANAKDFIFGKKRVNNTVGLS